MVEGLPPNGALARAAAGHHWQQRDYHAADTVDLLGRVLTVLINANRKEGTPEVPYPEQVWRPGDPTPEQRAKVKAERAEQDRADYAELVAMVTPDHARKG